VQQHTEGMVASIIWVLLEIYLAFQQSKNFENPLRIDKVITISLVYYFFETQCRFFDLSTVVHTRWHQYELLKNTVTYEPGPHVPHVLLSSEQGVNV